MAIFYPTGGAGGKSGSDDCTATRAQLLEGYTGILSDTDDEPAAGTMTNHGALNYSLPINGSYDIPAGYHNGSGRVSQSIPTQSAMTITPGANQQQVAAGRYLTGAITVPGFSMPAASLIQRGATINIYGRTVTGTWEGYVKSGRKYIYQNGIKNDPANWGGTDQGTSINYGNKTVTVTLENDYDLDHYDGIGAYMTRSVNDGTNGYIRVYVLNPNTDSWDNQGTNYIGNGPGAWENHDIFLSHLAGTARKIRLIFHNVAIAQVYQF